MSQRRPAPHPSSRRSQSPPRDAGIAPTRQRNPGYRDDTSARPPHDPGGAPAGEVGGGEQRRGSRSSGVLNMLNPLGSRGPLPASSPRVRRRSAETTPQVNMDQAPYGAGRPTEAGPHARLETGQLGFDSSPPRPQGLPGMGSMTPEQPQAMLHTRSPAEPTMSGLPQAIHPHALAATRRILTPKSPRTASLSRAAMRTVEAQRLASMPPLPGMTGPPAHAHDTSPLGGPPSLAAPPQFPGHLAGLGSVAPTPTRPTSSLSRSLSQPMMGHALPPTSSQEQPPPALPPLDHDARPMFSPNPPFSTPAGPSRSRPGEAGGRWGQLPPGATAVGGRNLQLGQGQQHVITITPTHGEEMLIPVDYQQASKAADEKRSKNADASARHRSRKKEKEARLAQENGKLESINRDLERRVEELEAERDHYRNQYNRLRDVVARTPGMAEWADRAPSPTRSRSVGSYAAENSPLPAPAPAPAPPLPPSHAHPFSHPQPLAHPHPPPSYNDPSMMERPARRRRTDSDPPPQLGNPSYRSNTPVSLPPPIPSAPSIYGSPRLSLSPGGTARLPPIRFDHPSTGPELTPPILGAPPPSSAAGSQPEQGGGYISYPYETGWATGPRGPTEGGSR